MSYFYMTYYVFQFYTILWQINYTNMKSKSYATSLFVNSLNIKYIASFNDKNCNMILKELYRY